TPLMIGTASLIRSASWSAAPGFDLYWRTAAYMRSLAWHSAAAVVPPRLHRFRRNRYGEDAPCYGKVEMSPLNKVEMSPFVEAGGGRFERGHFGDERGGAGAVLRIATCDARRVATGSRCGA